METLTTATEAATLALETMKNHGKARFTYNGKNFTIITTGGTQIIDTANPQKRPLRLRYTELVDTHGAAETRIKNFMEN